MRQWRHKRRGLVFTEICRVELHSATSTVIAGSTLVIYRGANGKLWAREEGEFEDGRFEEVPTDREWIITKLFTIGTLVLLAVLSFIYFTFTITSATGPFLVLLFAVLAWAVFASMVLK